MARKSDNTDDIDDATRESLDAAIHAAGGGLVPQPPEPVAPTIDGEDDDDDEDASKSSSKSKKN